MSRRLLSFSSQLGVSRSQRLVHSRSKKPRIRTRNQNLNAQRTRKQKQTRFSAMKLVYLFPWLVSVENWPVYMPWKRGCSRDRALRRSPQIVFRENFNFLLYCCLGKVPCCRRAANQRLTCRISNQSANAISDMTSKGFSLFSFCTKVISHTYLRHSDDVKVLKKEVSI